MKVGILTYHDTANYGAALQVHATQVALNNLGEDAEVIDYINEHRMGSYSVKKRFFNQFLSGKIISSIKTLIGMPMILNRTKQFALFYSKHIKMGSTQFRTRRSLLESPPVYDAYLVGSDQVWNYRNNGSDFNYMLDFVSDKNKTISYASSFGIDKIPVELIKEYKRTLKAIRALSVRENSGASLVRQLTDREVPVVLDPVFLMEKEYWVNLSENNTEISTNYIVNYTSKAGYVKQFCASTNYDIYKKIVINIGSDLTIGDMLNRKIKILSTVGPTHFLGLIKNADLILTSSFHGTAFAILMNKPFVVFLSGNDGRDARISELLSCLDLTNRIFGYKLTDDIVAHKINYQVVNQKLFELRRQSFSFLINSLRTIYSVNCKL
jgi:hypothetical protein